MPTAYRIRDWSKHFETADSRKLKAFPWVRCPVKQGRGYKRLVAADRTGAMLGVWTAIMQLAAQMPERGTLADDDGPLDADDIAVATMLDAETVQRAIDLLTDPANRIQWLESVEWEAVGDDREITGDNGRAQEITGDNREMSGDNGKQREITGNNGRLPGIERERERDEDEHEEIQKDISFSGDSLSDSSLSLSPPNRLRLDDALCKLYGRDGPARHPPDSPQVAADQTTAVRWVQDGVIHDGNFKAVMGLVVDAQTGKRRPMAWLTDKFRRKGWLT